MTILQKKYLTLQVKKKIMKKLIFVVLAIGVMGFGIYTYLYQDHRNIASEEVSVSKTVTAIFKEYQEDEKKANSLYLDKKVRIVGKITSINVADTILVLDNKLSAKIMGKITNKVNDEITLEGRLLGYDSLLEEINLDQTQIK